MRHIPSSDTAHAGVLTFEEALQPVADDYDRDRWLYVPDHYSEYRYILGTKGSRPLICIGINPSTAAPDRLDNTLKSAQRIALFNGYDSFIMFNVYAQRATLPDDMEKELNPLLHRENMKAFEWVLSQAEQPAVWAAWGSLIMKRPYLPACVKDMTEIGSRHDARWYTAGPRSKQGHPHHPLYLKKDSVLDPFTDLKEYLDSIFPPAARRAAANQNSLANDRHGLKLSLPPAGRQQIKIHWRMIAMGGNRPMMKTYTETITIRTCDCDLKGTWRLSAILEAMQEAAGTHSLLLGCGRDELLKQKIVWVLSRSELHMHRYPRAGEKITLHTFPMPNRICFFPRYYIFTDEHGEMIGKAGTLWLLMDIETRKMLPPGAVANLIPDNRDLTVPMNLPATVGNLQGEEFISEYMPVYTDLDVNGHVNNTRYADWLCNTLGIDLMSQSDPETVIFNYNHEILPGQKIRLRRIMHGHQYRLTGFVGDSAAFEIGGVLRPVEKD